MRPLILLIGFLFAVGQGRGADPVTSSSQRHGSFKATLSKAVAYEYLVYLPTGYVAQPEKRWPVLLFLHGSGENGSDVERLRQAPLPKFIEATVAGGMPTAGASEAAKLLTSEFIVLAPQCPLGQGWVADELIALLDDFAPKYKTEPARVYVTGLSMGGFGTWSLGMRYPQRFAAIAPICGGGDLVDVGTGLPAKGPALKSLPIWVFHGAKDTSVAPSESQRMIDAVKRITGNSSIQFTLYPEAGHDSWTETYSKPEFYRWFLAHRR